MQLHSMKVGQTTFVDTCCGVSSAGVHSSLSTVLDRYGRVERLSSKYLIDCQPAYCVFLGENPPVSRKVADVP